LEAGETLKVVSARLGHAQTAITSDLYQHVSKQLDQEAANRVAGYILWRVPLIFVSNVLANGPC